MTLPCICGIIITSDVGEALASLTPYANRTSESNLTSEATTMNGASDYRIYAQDMQTGKQKHIFTATHYHTQVSLEQRGQAYANNNNKMVNIVRQDIGYDRTFVPQQNLPY